MRDNSTPYYTVLSGGGNRDITRYCTGLLHEDCSKADDLLKITIKHADLALIESADFQVGRTIIAQYGYIRGDCSPRIEMEISGADTSFSATNGIIINCASSGYRLKKDTHQTVWSKKQLNQVFSEIAERSGLKAIIDVPNRLIDYEPQGNLSDLDFMWSLLKKTGVAVHAGGVPYHVIVKNATMHVGPHPIGKPPVRAFFLGPNGQILEFTPKLDNQAKGAGARKITAATMNSATGKYVYAQADDTTDPSAKLGAGALMGNAAAFGQPGFTTDFADYVNKVTPGNGQVLEVPGMPPAQAKDYLNNIKAERGMKEITARVKLNQGDPTVRAGEVYSFKGGMGSMHSGNWLTDKVINELGDGKAFDTTLEIERNATMRAQAVKQAATNAALTDKGTTQGVKVYRVDGQTGIPLGQAAVPGTNAPKAQAR